MTNPHRISIGPADARMRWRDGARGNPFAWLSEIGCPVRIATAGDTWPVYKEMASRAIALLPAASQWRFEGVGHCVGQEAPAL
jgi:pimeloyl-ACP methyl ester carboxylesterase